jgi:S-methylmethionine-dependent homocysteine/selenocysteine methylase
MAQFRKDLPQLAGDFFITDGGLETTLIFLEGFELPDFAAFDLLKHENGETALRNYYRAYAELAQRFGVGVILESATWRASADWGTKLGYGAKEIADVNRQSIALLNEIRNEYASDANKVVISGCLGPRGDGYKPVNKMSEKEAESYHQNQIQTFENTVADMATAITMNYAEEAVGIAQAAKYADMPVVISFTVETDGRLPSGQTLQEAIAQVDSNTSFYPAYYMINCAHPTHFEHVLAEEETWKQRVRGLRANASRMSHAELDESSELDSGDPFELGKQYAQLKISQPQLNVMGGCCGTDISHLEQIAAACSPIFRKAN